MKVCSFLIWCSILQTSILYSAQANIHLKTPSVKTPSLGILLYTSEMLQKYPITTPRTPQSRHSDPLPKTSISSDTIAATPCSTPTNLQTTPSGTSGSLTPPPPRKQFREHQHYGQITEKFLETMKIAVDDYYIASITRMHSNSSSNNS
jgi:hypothetical protein